MKLILAIITLALCSCSNQDHVEYLTKDPIHDTIVVCLPNEQNRMKCDTFYRYDFTRVKHYIK